MVNKTEGEYFTFDQYMAIRESYSQKWRVSKVTLNPNNSKEMSLTLVHEANSPYEALMYMEASTGTDTLEAVAKTVRKTDNSGICGPRIGYLD